MPLLLCLPLLLSCPGAAAAVLNAAVCVMLLLCPGLPVLWQGLLLCQDLPLLCKSLLPYLGPLLCSGGALMLHRCHRQLGTCSWAHCAAPRPGKLSHPPSRPPLG
jgi:hypothetical protein